MGRLKQLPPRLKPMAPRLAAPPPQTEADRSRHRDASQPWRQWYKTADWQRLRWSILERDLFTCRMCWRIEAKTSLLVADHIRPHRGDAALFWSPANLQCLCKACHDKTKQSQERAGRW